MCQHQEVPQWALTLTLSHPEWLEPWAATVEVCDSCLLALTTRMDARETPEVAPEKRPRATTTDRARENYQAGKLERRGNKT